mgnify:FL=1
MIRIELNGIGVFRSEDENGCIIERHSKFKEIDERHSNYHVFPSFALDDYLCERIDWDNIKDYRFAFKSLEQFYSAFEVEEVKEFITLGFEVFYIEATETVESPYQIVFKPENVTLKQNISNLFV